MARPRLPRQRCPCVRKPLCPRTTAMDSSTATPIESRKVQVCDGGRTGRPTSILNVCVTFIIGSLPCGRMPSSSGAAVRPPYPRRHVWSGTSSIGCILQSALRGRRASVPSDGARPFCRWPIPDQRGRRVDRDTHHAPLELETIDRSPLPALPTFLGESNDVFEMVVARRRVRFGRRVAGRTSRPAPTRLPTAGHHDHAAWHRTRAARAGRVGWDQHSHRGRRPAVPV